MYHSHTPTGYGPDACAYHYQMPRIFIYREISKQKKYKDDIEILRHRRRI